MPARFSVTVTDRPEIAQVLGTLIKVVKKKADDDTKVRRVVHSFDAGKFKPGDATQPAPKDRDRWELELKLPGAAATARVLSYLVHVVVLDRRGRVIDGFIRRRLKTP